VFLAVSGQYQTALPGYHYNFPRDHFNHPDFQTEWWYYTGNIKSPDGHRFGFELTFFRQGVDRDAKSMARGCARLISCASIPSLGLRLRERQGSTRDLVALSKNTDSRIRSGQDVVVVGI